MNGTDVPDIPDVRSLQDRMARHLHGDGRSCVEIVVSGLPQKEISMKALSAVEAHNIPAYIFNRAGNRIWVIKDEEGNPKIEILSENSVRYILERACQFYVFREKKVDKKIEYTKTPLAPPKPTVQDLLGAPSWPLPPLEGVIECPYMFEDGSIITEAGYNPQTKLFLVKKDLEDLSIPEVVTKEQVVEAKRVIDDIFVDFMFVDEASHTNNVATLLTAVLRPLIPGITPLFMYDKPIMGSGASFLSKIIIIIATGRVPNLITAPDNDEEMEKKIMAVLFSGMKIIVFDNCEGKVYFKSLASALTAEVVSQRLFGKNTAMVGAKNNVVWIINGNNIQLGGDLPRRCVPIRIDPKTSRPWQRTEWTHPNIMEYVFNKRSEILRSILILAKFWQQEGRPKPPSGIPTIGSYERWCEVIGGILTAAGYPSFLGNLEKMYQESDVETPQWEAFLSTWYDFYKSDRKRVKDIVERLENELNSARPEYNEKLKFSDVIPDFILGTRKTKDFSKVLGKALLKIRDREFPNGLKVIQSGIEHKTATWRVLKKDELGGLVGFGGLRSPNPVQQNFFSEACRHGRKPYHQTTQTPLSIPATKDEAVALLEKVNGDYTKLSEAQKEAIKKVWKDQK